ncbi:MAG: nuclear transport factor 2 family protein, partial [Steroidobacteraceae bacterium]
LVLSSPSHALSQDPTSWFQSTTQTLLDAVATGNKAVWDRVLDADCMITTEDGEVVGKARFLKELEPLPAGFSGRIKVRGLTVRLVAGAAVVHYWLDEVEEVFGQTLRTTYVETDTYQRVRDSWKMIAMQVTVVPRDLEPITVSSAGWPALVGDYRYSDKAISRYQVFLRDGTLYGGRDAQSATRLIPLAPLVFFQQGSIHIMVFVQDRSGAVTEVRELHKYNEVRMKRIAGSA